MTTQRLYRNDSEAVATILGNLETIERTLEKTTGFYLAADCVRLWNQGYSPGYFKTEDGMWVFVLDYMEDDEA